MHLVTLEIVCKCKRSIKLVDNMVGFQKYCEDVCLGIYRWQSFVAFVLTNYRQLLL